MTEYVKYVGLAHRRVITSEDFRRAGFPNVDGVEWSAANGFSVPLDRFGSEDLVNAVFREDDGFIIVGGEEHAPRKVAGPVMPMTPAQYDAPRVDLSAITIDPDTGETVVNVDQSEAATTSSGETVEQGTTAQAPAPQE